MTRSNHKAPCKWGQCILCRVLYCCLVVIVINRGLVHHGFCLEDLNKPLLSLRGKRPWSWEKSPQPRIPKRSSPSLRELRRASSGHASSQPWCWVRNRYPIFPLWWSSLRKHGRTGARLSSASPGKYTRMFHVLGSEGISGAVARL